MAGEYDMHVALIGYRGSGKSTVGRVLAEELARPFVDTDRRIEQEAGQTIAEIFRCEGEAGFRDREAAVLRACLAEPPSVLALGGGAVLRPGNRELLKGRAWVVWLQADPDTLYDRIAADTGSRQTRPDLTPSGGRAEVHRLLADRLPVYRQCADWTVDTSSLGIDAIVAQVVPQARSLERGTRTSRTDP